MLVIFIIYFKSKVRKVVSVQAMKACTVSGGINPHFLKLGSRRT
jgi:hypothetical protein